MNKENELRTMLASVDRLAKEMKKKLREKARQGYSGGLDPTNRYNVIQSLHDHVHKLTTMCPHCKALDGEMEAEGRQAIDIANLAMMLWVLEGRPT